MNSTHRVEVVPVAVLPHPNADRLGIVNVWGYTAIVAKDSWKDGDLGAYIPPDSLVDPARPEFSFLAGDAKERYEGRVRVKAKKLRGVASQGLLVKAPEGLQAGDDAAEALGVTHYVEPVKFESKGVVAKPPRQVDFPRYDIDAWRRYRHLLEPGEMVVVTEKIHGANSRFVFDEDGLHVGSRSIWKGETATDPWWSAFRKYPQIEEFLRRNPGCTLFGEIYGYVQDLRYGHDVGEVSFAAFDLRRKDGSWVEHAQAEEHLMLAEIPLVPQLYAGPYDEAHVETLAEGQSLLADHVREGCVVKPLQERFAAEIGRVILKIVGNGYLERA